MRRILILALLVLLALAAVLGPVTSAQDPDRPEELGTFEPSEVLPADSSVSFPVDI